MGSFEATSFPQIEEENGKLEHLVADLSLHKAMLRDVSRQKI